MQTIFSDSRMNHWYVAHPLLTKPLAEVWEAYISWQSVHNHFCFFFENCPPPGVRGGAWLQPGRSACNDPVLSHYWWHQVGIWGMLLSLSNLLTQDPGIRRERTANCYSWVTLVLTAALQREGTWALVRGPHSCSNISTTFNKVPLLPVMGWTVAPKEICWSPYLQYIGMWPYLEIGLYRFH